LVRIEEAEEVLGLVFGTEGRDVRGRNGKRPAKGSGIAIRRIWKEVKAGALL
jgi:hypothetical protein